MCLQSRNEDGRRKLTLSLVKATSVNNTVVGVKVDVLVVLVTAQAEGIASSALLGGGDGGLDTLDGALGEEILDGLASDSLDGNGGEDNGGGLHIDGFVWRG